MQTTGTFLTFALGGECYAVAVQNAQTVIERSKVTHIPRMPDFMMGVINFRGRVVPLLDLHRKLGIPRGEAESGGDSQGCVIVILELPWQGRSLTLGVRVDEVREVIDIDPAMIEATPSIGSSGNMRFMQGIARRAEEFLLVLDAERILESDELSDLGEHLAAS
ncbi:MAG: chemotaxis protein CheW [Spirochaetaceae bacterium]